MSFNYSRDFTRVLSYLDRAVAILLESGNQDDLPRGLLARAECYRLMKQFSNARGDLNKAFEIAESGGMKLFICDYHLEAGRLCRAEGKEEEAGEHFSRAEEIIGETGYYRKKNDVDSWQLAK